MYFKQYCRLHVMVAASDIDVIRAARKRLRKDLRKDRKWRDARHFFFNRMLEQHHEAIRLSHTWG